MMTLFEHLNKTLTFEMDVRDSAQSLRRRLAEMLGIDLARTKKEKSTSLPPHQFLSQCFIEDEECQHKADLEHLKSKVCMCSIGVTATAFVRCLFLSCAVLLFL